MQSTRPRGGVVLFLASWSLALSVVAAAGACAGTSSSAGDDAGPGVPEGSSPSSDSAGGDDRGATGSPDAAGPADATSPGVDAGGGGPDGAAPSTDGGRPDVSSPGTDAGGGGPDASGGFTCPPGPFGNPLPATVAPTRVMGIPPKADINMQGNGFTTVEGPAWIGNTLYMSEFPGNPSPPPSRIITLSLAGDIGIVGAALMDGGVDTGSNGLAVDRAGNLYGAIHKDGSVSRIDPQTGARTPIASMYMGKRFNSPNDLSVRSDGTIYFSDPNGSQTPSPAPQMQARVYRVDPTGAVSVVDATLTAPNGVTLSIDEATLYVSSNNGVFAYAVAADGSTGPRPNTPITTMNIDGMGIDCAGNLYGAVINTPNVVVFSPSGTMIGMVTVPGNPAPQGVVNVAFGGADHKRLYITAQGSSLSQGLYQVDLNVPGMPN